LKELDCEGAAAGFLSTALDLMVPDAAFAAAAFFFSFSAAFFAFPS